MFWARLASFGHFGLISDPLILSKFHNETHDPKGQENKIYTIVKGGRRSTAVAFHLGLRCYPKYLFRGFRNTKG